MKFLLSPLFVFPILILVGSCSYDDETLVGDPSNFSETGNGLTLSGSLSGVQDYIADNLPEATNNAIVAGLLDKGIFKKQSASSQFNSRSTLNRSTVDVFEKWASTESADLIYQPGGTSPTDDCPDDRVNFKTYIIYSLDSTWERITDEDDDDVCNLTHSYQPTVFGRLSGDLNIITAILEQEEPVDQVEGMFVPGEYVRPFDTYLGRVDLTLVISNTSNTSYYDQLIEVPEFSFKMYLRNDSNDLNLLTYEDGTYGSFSVLAWDKQTGELAYEYLADNGATPSESNLETFRVYIASTGGQSYLIGYNGTSASNFGLLDHYAISGAQGGQSTQATVSFYRDYTNASGNVAAGLLCMTLPDATAINSGACAGENYIDVSTTFAPAIAESIAYDDFASIVAARGLAADPEGYTTPFRSKDTIYNSN